MSRQGFISLDVDLDDVLDKIDTDVLIKELERRKVADHEFDVAGAAFARGQTRECLIHLERALPRTFSGLVDRVLGSRQ